MNIYTISNILVVAENVEMAMELLEKAGKKPSSSKYLKLQDNTSRRIEVLGVQK